jgi:hypothetical protein
MAAAIILDDAVLAVHVVVGDRRVVFGAAGEHVAPSLIRSSMERRIEGAREGRGGSVLEKKVFGERYALGHLQLSVAGR